MDINTFRKRFKDFSEIEQDLLKILAIAYEPVNQSGMTNLLKEFGTRRSNGTQVTSPQVKEMREGLDETGWLELGEKNEMQVAPKYLEMVMRMAVIDPRFRKIVQVVRKEYPYREWYYQSPRNFNVCLRDMRIALYEGDIKRFEEVALDITRFYQENYARINFFGSFFHPFDAEWLATFPADIQGLAIAHLMKDALEKLEPVEPYLEYAASQQWLKVKKQDEPFFSQSTLAKLLQGNLHEASELLAVQNPDYGKLAREGMLAFFSGHIPLALLRLEEGLKLFRKMLDQKNIFYPDFAGVVFLLAILKGKEKEYFKTVHNYAQLGLHLNNGKMLNYLRAAVFFQENRLKEADQCLLPVSVTALDWLIYGLVSFWNGRSLTVLEADKLRQWHDKAAQHGYRWAQMEFAWLLSRLYFDKNKAKDWGETAAALEKELGIPSVISIVQRTEKWERSLDALLQIQPIRGRKSGKPEKMTRLVWWLNLGHHEVQPVEQTFGKGGWSKGRNIALKRLKEGNVDNMTEQDKQAAKSIKVYNQGYYGSVEYYFEFEKLLTALAGHPLLFLMENPSISVELVEKKPQLLVEEVKDGYEIKFNYDFKDVGVHLIKETPTRYLMVQADEQHLEINRLLDFGNLRVPVAAREKLIEAVGSLSSIVTVQSEVGGEAMDIQTIEGEATPCLHLLPVGDGFKLEFFVKPFTNEPPYFKPGAGRENVIAEVSGVPMRATRDLKKEKENARRVEDACPSLQKIPSDNREWLFDEIEDCLNVLVELEPLREAGEVILEHPKGEKLRIAGQVDFGGLSLGIKKERDWFEVKGEVRVNENLVMDFRQLLDLAQNANSRFIEISDGQFIALTTQLRRRLEELNNLFSKTKNDLRFHPLAAHAMEDFTGLLHDVKVDAAWKKQLSRLNEARDLNPKIPSTFKAELRNYQQEGFRWLSQLAYWGVGACLADDMGLGKTIQALALLVDRGKAGPALVIAPASVVRNWYHEAQRFAPTLNPLIFGQSDRKEMLDNLQPFDLLLCSYGLMQQESEQLAAIHFTTIVLDEAQAIKNRSTKRSQAAMQLQADFKIITTGTPIENHLGEIWNLFNFLNPGLLGSLERFNASYAVPIEKFQDKESRNQLRRLLQPFILRRRKNDVLQELPEKTEVTLTVELSPEERAFYEALRRKAIESIENTNGDFTQKRFQILAELMRLRQACCHPRMVTPESELPSSKLGLFAETVEELLENGHKALVFSQFVKHLKIVEEWVQKQGISYQYLDGSTSMQNRDKAIRAFQAGEGDLFLISLKAGGFGLNLTAADYVLHLDPWWNPAVEDQASDRAHRIGQHRPVTIYRLVTENTIEEKIVQLHSEKRGLADSLLEGTEVSAALSAEQLLELMKG